MVRVKRQTYANYITTSLKHYEEIHGLIEEFGGKVKQFSQDVRYNDIWYIFFEMAKLQREEFEQAIKDFIIKDKLAVTKTV